MSGICGIIVLCVVFAVGGRKVGEDGQNVRADLGREVQRAADEYIFSEAQGSVKGVARLGYDLDIRGYTAQAFCKLFSRQGSGIIYVSRDDVREQSLEQMQRGAVLVCEQTDDQRLPPSG